jgi:ABC-type molybdate transport system substrate-binding protein
MWVKAAVFLTLVALAGCRDKVVVYADPWLEEFAVTAVDSFYKENPDVDVELKIVSSEVIASHIRFGQPVDVFLCFGPYLVESVGIQSFINRSESLASERMALVKVLDQGKFSSFHTLGCMAWEASHRPSRTYAESLMNQTDGLEIPECKIVANFQSQMEGYMLRSWVPIGVVPNSFHCRNSKHLAVLAEGEAIPDAYKVILTRQGAENHAASAFYQYLFSKKTSKILAELCLIP